MRAIHRWFIVVLALVAAAAALWAWRSRPVEVPTRVLSAAPLVRSVAVTGRVATQARVWLGATLTARVREVRVREGSSVAAGALLVVLDDAELQAALAQADAALAGAQARLSSQRRLAGPLAQQQLAQARANAAAAAAERERAEDLFRQGFIGQSRLDEARRAAAVAASAVESAQAAALANTQGAELEAAQARVAEAVAARALARSRLDQMRLLAPADAVVLTRLAEPGQIVQPGTRLLELSLAGPLQLVAQVDEKYLSQLAVGQRAAVLADAFAGQRFEAHVASIAPGVDAARGSVEVKFSLPAPPAFLRSDMTLSIEVETGRRESALVLPADAWRPDGSVLVVDADGRAQRRAVRAGLRTATAVEIVEGLKAGERVIVGGASGVPAIEPGQRVRAVAADAQRRPGDNAAAGEAMNSAVQSMGR